MTFRQYRLHLDRARAIALITLCAFALGPVLFNPAHAYFGQELLSWVGDNIIFPLGILSLVLALAAALFRPDLVKQGVYATIICAAIFFIIRVAPQLQSILQSG